MYDWQEESLRTLGLAVGGELGDALDTYRALDVDAELVADR
jgi:hypothetical protein